VIAAAVFPPPPKREPPLVPELPTPEPSPKPDAPRAPAVGALKPEPLRVKPAANELVEVRVNVRPFGYLSVDGAARSAEPLQLHLVKVPAGRHRFLVTCDEVCESAGHAEALDVQPGRVNELNIAAPLKPSMVAFEGFPVNAMVRVGSEVRAAVETTQRPFQIVTPREGSKSLRHAVSYEVTIDGRKVQADTAMVKPGLLERIQKRGE
jgi:serine/threonine-protein kinase